MKYIVVRSTQIIEFELKCTHAMDKGGVPIGGVSSSDIGSRSMTFPKIEYLQAFSVPDDYLPAVKASS